MFILKIKGHARIPDFIQLRDDDFTLVAYMRLDNMENGIEKFDLAINKNSLIKFVETLPFGRIEKLTI